MERYGEGEFYYPTDRVTAGMPLCVVCRVTRWYNDKIALRVEGALRQGATNLPCKKHEADVAAALLRIEGVG